MEPFSYGMQVKPFWLHVIRATLIHMANLTLVIDDGVLRRARIRAVQEDTSVNAQVRDFLAAYASNTDVSRQQQAMSQLVTLAQNTQSGGGLNNRTWTRDNLHER